MDYLLYCYLYVCSDDIRHMFERITEFQPRKIELETKLLPFVPEFIPAIGDIDAFLKIPRPDGHPDGIGLMGENGRLRDSLP